MKYYNPIDMTSAKIINLGTGTNPNDAVNKAQMDAATAAITTTATNGIVKIGQDHRLGGTLTALTTINAQSNPLLITNSLFQVIGNGAVAGSGPFAAQNNASLNLLFCENHGRVGMSGYLDVISTAIGQFGGSTVTAFPVIRENAAFIKVLSPSTSSAIHIEFNKVLTAAAWDMTVEMKGCFPQNSDNLPNTYSAVSYCQMNNAVITLQQSLGLQNVQQITWYKSSTGKPVMKLHTLVGLKLGNSAFTIKLHRGGFDEIPDISQVVLNLNVNI